MRYVLATVGDLGDIRYRSFWLLWGRCENRVRMLMPCILHLTSWNYLLLILTCACWRLQLNCIVTFKDYDVWRNSMRIYPTFVTFFFPILSKHSDTVFSLSTSFTCHLPPRGSKYLQLLDQSVRTFLKPWRYNLRGSIYSSNPNVLIAHSKSSPLIVFRFSRWHLSLALFLHVSSTLSNLNGKHTRLW